MRLIDADALRNVILNDMKLDGANANWEVNRILVHIDNAPTIPLPDFKEGYKQAIIDGKTNFSRPQGEWIKHDTWDYSCSICEATSTVDDGIVEDLPNFCPNCGARMVKNE